METLFTINGERFVAIKNYDGYAIGDNGTVMSKRMGNKWRKLSPYCGSTSAYLCVTLKRNDGIYKHCLIHRLVALHFINGWFEGAVVGHKDANIYNNHYTNLKWITQEENIHQSYADSGINALRNYKHYQVLKDGEVVSPILVGGTELRDFLQKYNPCISYTSLVKYRRTKNYTLNVWTKQMDKEICND